MLPYDNRRMRLDRILLREKNQIFKLKNIYICAKEEIGFLLNSSDHFMLVCELELKD